ncbi:MAG: formate dehydrogenase accessory sulfurtransferase FdhD [Methanoregulaceae archaeon]|nr:formate dehydrogenase accessory sulfurtransferase FdhD [Methanoregulaceae archaeon]
MMFREMPCTKVEGDSFRQSTHEVIEEVPLTLIVNGRNILTAMTSPGMAEEFATGYLYTERIIHSIDEIESLIVEENRVSVLTKNPFKILVSKKTVLSGCGGTSSFLDPKILPNIESDLTVDTETIRNAMKETLRSDLHDMTGGIHITGLFTPSEKILVTEDIGRHNALDRLIGYGLRNGVDLSGTFVTCSGRISSEMVRKCLTANIPVIASRGATTTMAINMAETAGLTVVGFVRNKKMNIYSGTDRIRP